MNILETIKAAKIKEVISLKNNFHTSDFENSPFFNRKCHSLVDALSTGESSGIIAEFKRQSPSKGGININADVTNVCKGYQKAGAAIISVLTDTPFFGARTTDFNEARIAVNLPLLRKDFILDEIQILEAKAMGADAILLIAKLLTVEEISQLAAFAKSLGLEVLVELQNKNEAIACHSIDAAMFGINNRNLINFEMDYDSSIDLLDCLPNNSLRISESGITQPSIINTLKQLGYNGFLIGSHFMEDPDPAAKCFEFIKESKR